MTKIINLTPHAINVIDKNGDTRTFEPSGFVARVTTISTIVNEIDGIDVHKTNFGAVDFGTDIEPNTIVIVSSIVLAAMKDVDVPFKIVAPNTSQAVRNEKGHIVAVHGFTV